MWSCTILRVEDVNPAVIRCPPIGRLPRVRRISSGWATARIAPGPRSAMMALWSRRREENRYFIRQSFQVVASMVGAPIIGRLASQEVPLFPEAVYLTSGRKGFAFVLKRYCLRGAPACREPPLFLYAERRTLHFVRAFARTALHRIGRPRTATARSSVNGPRDDQSLSISRSPRLFRLPA